MGVEAERATRSRAMAEKSMFDTVVLGIDRTELAEEALRLARDEGDPVVVARALIRTRPRYRARRRGGRTVHRRGHRPCPRDRPGLDIESGTRS